MGVHIFSRPCQPSSQELLEVGRCLRCQALLLTTKGGAILSILSSHLSLNLGLDVNQPTNKTSGKHGIHG